MLAYVSVPLIGALYASLRNMNQLIITAEHDDYSLCLTGTLDLDDYSGFGEAWYNLRSVKDFCSQLDRLSSSMEGSAELIGSISKPKDDFYLETFSLRCSVLSSSKLNGIVGVHVTLANYPYSDCRISEIRQVSGELKVRNHRLKEFSESLKQLINGNEDQVVLSGGAII